MPEKTLNDPLSGAEIKIILLQEIKRRLDGDSTLLDDLAYGGFAAKFDIKVSFVRSLTPTTLIWGNAERTAEGETEPAGATILVADYTSPAPNVARQEHDLPVPVLVQTPSGPQRRKVHIEKAMK